MIARIDGGVALLLGLLGAFGAGVGIGWILWS